MPKVGDQLNNQRLAVVVSNDHGVNSCMVDLLTYRGIVISCLWVEVYIKIKYGNIPFPIFHGITIGMGMDMVQFGNRNGNRNNTRE